MKEKILIIIAGILNLFVCSAAFIIIFLGSDLYTMPLYNDVLVVINDNSPESVEIGNYFVSNRHIPSQNVCHIAVNPNGETNDEIYALSIPEKETALLGITSHIQNNNLGDSINYIVLTRGIPYWAKSDMGDGTIHIFDMYLQFNLANSGVDIFSFNPYFYYIYNNQNNREDYNFTRSKYGYYIISRLDGPGVENVKKLIDSTGALAYNSYTNGINYITMNPSSLDPEDLKGQEFALRENISIHTPHLLNGETINDYKNNVMFLFLNLVDDKYYDGDNNFYALGDSYLRYPFIYRKLDFLPGSLATIYRST
ncbi:MAG TPA: hypothetical protein DC049_06380, partial [Spirochaetia bacterium]|nr:hypothetical protein [Spirochaetia bacterium]